VKDYGPETYGDRIAGVYDGFYEHLLDTEAAVEALARLAGSGPVLELAVGTGRIAVPLAQRGIDVRGIDASQEMVARMRAKPGGADIQVTIGDFAEVGVPGPYALVYLVFNTIFALLTQDDQVRCFENVAARLAPGGRFVVEAFVPDPTRWDRDQRVSTTAIDLDRVDLDVSRHDPVEQRVESQHLTVTPDGTRMYPVRLRYAYPSELDLMARLAGLELVDRWGGWKGESFTAASGGHVSIYGLRTPASRGSASSYGRP
jgi:SAM-dependent methyltransferase